MQLSILIVSYNVKHYLSQCLCSLSAACRHIDAEIIVIDNASADETLRCLQPKFPWVRFIQNETNTGFSKANNRALWLAKGRYILYLNPDTIVGENVLYNCLSFLQTTPAAGAAGVRMINGNGQFLPESKRSYPSLMASLFKLSGLATRFPNSGILNRYALGNLQEDGVHVVQVLAGAFLLSRRSLLHQLEGFDEAFFMYGEDIDLSYRLQCCGYTNFYLGNNTIVHFKGESTKRDKTYIKHFYEAMHIFVRKHRPASALLLKPAIRAAALVAGIGQSVNKAPAVEHQQTKATYLLAGPEAAVASAAVILKANDHAYDTLTGNVPAVLEVLGQHTQQISNIVFCLQGDGAGACIMFMQQQRKRYHYYWHYAGTDSIVAGSSSGATPQIYLRK